MTRLWVQLSGAFLLVALVAVGVIAVLIGRAVDTNFRGYLGQEFVNQNVEPLMAELKTYFAEHGSWAGAGDILPGPRGQGRGGQYGQGRGFGGQGGGARFTLIDASGAVLAATDETLVGQTVSQADLARAYPLQSADQVVGWLLVETPSQTALTSAQASFLNEVNANMLWAAALAAALALLIGLGIGRFVSQPIRQLTGAAKRIAGGDLGKTVDVRRTSAAEIQTLAETFNHMSTALAEGEAARQRMAADIAHELRTPLSVMRSQLQAILDGLYPGDSAHIAVVYDQALHLNRLVDDLRLLTQAESGQLPLEKRPIQPAELLAGAKALFEPLAQDAGLRLTLSCEDDLPPVLGDADRLRQVLGNLIANALRHTPAGGEINVRAIHGDQTVTFAVTNTGITLTPEQAEHVFDRFWRADEARSRDQGGSGLGLAIARQILQLHGGRIWVELRADKTMFAFEMPSVSPPG